MTLILVFGDSITYGAWDTNGGWVQRLRTYLDKKQLADPKLYYELYNLGVSGDTSTDLLERFEAETKQRIKRMSAKEEIIIIVAIGTNDSIINNKTKKH